MTADVVGTSLLSSALGVVYFLHAIPYLVSPPVAGQFCHMTFLLSYQYVRFTCWCDVKGEEGQQMHSE